ncbi:MAG: LpxI family protein [Planctomycetes bacterium]|nr:LpxI family protein [Planctomycetota bacterium]
MNPEPRTPNPEPRLGLIAGNGLFPILFARCAKERAVGVVALAIEGEARPELEKEVEKLHWVGLAKLGQMIRILKREGLTRAAMAGGVTKADMFSTVLYRRFRPDLRAIQLWYQKVRDRKDHSILGAFADELEGEGIKLESSLLYLDKHLADKGCMTRRKPSRRELADVEFGWPIAKQVAQLEIGQTLVVKERCVVAAEGIEGTDEAIRRGAKLAGKGIVVVKLAKANQDLRFDVPTVGENTVATLREVGANALAIEAGKTLMLDKPAVIAAADQAHITLVGR